MPLDTHVHRIAQYLGLTKRNQGDWKTAVEVTDALRQLEPADPLKYDFALAHLGSVANVLEYNVPKSANIVTSEAFAPCRLHSAT